MNLLKQLKTFATDTTSSSSGPMENWYITAESAEGIKDTDRFSKSDPYLKIDFGGKHVRTRTIKNDRTPHWNETFHFKLSANNAKDISIKLVDDDIGLDDTIGTAKISNVELPSRSGEEKTLKVPVLHKEQICGIVNLRIKKVVDGVSSSTTTSSSYQQNQMPSQPYNNSVPQHQSMPSSYNQHNMPPTYNTHNNPQYNGPSTYNTSQPYNQQPSMMGQNQPQYHTQPPPQYQSQPYQQPHMNAPQTNYNPNANNYGGQYQQQRY